MSFATGASAKPTRSTPPPRRSVSAAAWSRITSWATARSRAWWRWTRALGRGCGFPGRYAQAEVRWALICAIMVATEPFYSDHGRIEERSLALHQLVAEKVQAAPALL